VYYTDVNEVKKENTALVVPNAINVKLWDGTDYFFQSFVSRDQCFDALQLRINDEKIQEARKEQKGLWERARNLMDDEEAELDEEEEENLEVSDFVFEDLITPTDVPGDLNWVKIFKKKCPATTQIFFQTFVDPETCTYSYSDYLEADDTSVLKIDKLERDNEWPECYNYDLVSKVTDVPMAFKFMAPSEVKTESINYHRVHKETVYIYRITDIKDTSMKGAYTIFERVYVTPRNKNSCFVECAYSVRKNFEVMAIDFAIKRTKKEIVIKTKELLQHWKDQCPAEPESSDEEDELDRPSSKRDAQCVCCTIS